MGTDMRYGALLPEIALLGGAVVILLAGSWLPRARQHLLLPAAWLALAVAIGGGTAQAFSAPTTIFTGTFALDAPTAAIRIIAPVSTAVVLAMGVTELRGQARQSESIVLLLLATLGALVVAGANDLLVLAAGFLLSSIPLYGLIGIARTGPAAEAVLKTYLQGALFGVLLLGGITVLFATGRATTYPAIRPGTTDGPALAIAIGAVGVVAGLLFEAGAVPAHFWVPDATQAATRTVAAFLTTVPKLAGLIALARLVQLLGDTVDLRLLIAIVAAATMTIGNLAAFWQQNVRRLLGWSTISQVGYLLMPLVATHDRGSAALLLYLAAYATTNLTAFAVLAALPGRATIDDWAGTGRGHPLLAATLIVSLLSLVGTPPTGVFFGKLAAFTAAWDGGYGWLVAVAAANSVASLFYYLRWITAALQPAAVARRGTNPLAGVPATVALVMAALTLTIGVAMLPVMNGVSQLPQAQP